MLDAYVYSGLRSPFGRQAGVLAPIRPDDLIAQVIKELVARSPFSPEQVEDGQEHLALTMGALDDENPILVRLHSECLTGDALFSQRCDCGSQLKSALTGSWDVSLILCIGISVLTL